MKTNIGILIIACIASTGRVNAQTVATVPSDAANNRFATEYFSVIRPGLSLNGFDNSGSTSRGLGLKQVLNEALSGDVYINNKLNAIFNDANNPLQTNNPTQDQVLTNSRILQYTAFEALTSYILEENGIDPATLNMRDHADAMANLKSKLLFINDYYMVPVQ